MPTFVKPVLLENPGLYGNVTGREVSEREVRVQVAGFETLFGVVYFVSSRRKVIRSFLSLAFLRPPKAILVPGMYFLGFSRYSN